MTDKATNTEPSQPNEQNQSKSSSIASGCAAIVVIILVIAFFGLRAIGTAINKQDGRRDADLVFAMGRTAREVWWINVNALPDGSSAQRQFAGLFADAYFADSIDTEFADKPTKLKEVRGAFIEQLLELADEEPDLTQLQAQGMLKAKEWIQEMKSRPARPNETQWELFLLQRKQVLEDDSLVTDLSYFRPWTQEFWFDKNTGTRLNGREAEDAFHETVLLIADWELGYGG